MALERRSHERFPFSSRLEVRIARPVEAHAEEGSLLVGDAVDVSVGGFCFRSPQPLAVGDVIAVTLPEVASPLATTMGDLSILAVVRRVITDSADYLIGAERHA